MCNRIVKRFKYFLQKIVANSSVTNDVEKRVEKLEERVQHLEQSRDQEQSSPIVIEQLYIEKLLVDKVDLNNNIGTLSISELSGMLNIGANYGGGAAQQDKEQGQVPNTPPFKDKIKKQSKQEKEPSKNSTDLKQSKREQGPTFKIGFKVPEQS